MGRNTSIFLLLTSILTFISAQTQLPSRTTTTDYAPTETPTLSPVSYSYTYTVTTPTTIWASPAFPTATDVPLATCSKTMCPALDGKRCRDDTGEVWAVLCGTRFSGVVITTSVKKDKMMLEREAGTAGSEGVEGREVEERTYTGTFMDCAGYCTMFDVSLCPAVWYENGQCMALDTVTGTFAEPGAIAALRLGWVKS